MNELQATAVMIGLFALRCIVPLLLTLALVHLMNRLLARWSAAEAAPATQPAVVRPLPVAAASRPSQTPSIACWLLNNCSEEKRACCPAYRLQGVPCWQARLIEEGKLPDNCPTCPQYVALAGA